MQMRRASWLRWLWLPALGVLLAACASQGAAPAATTATTAPTTAAATTEPTAVPSAASLPSASPLPATAELATAIPSNSPATSTAPAATPRPAGPSATSTPDPAVATVLAYLEARARSDVTAVTNLSCKTWKTKAVTEAISFRSMNAKLVGVTCQVNGSAGSFTLVGCGGKMVTTYGTETRDWDLSAFVYQATAEDGQWKMCGYH